MTELLNEICGFIGWDRLAKTLEAAREVKEHEFIVRFQVTPQGLSYEVGNVETKGNHILGVIQKL